MKLYAILTPAGNAARYEGTVADAKAATKDSDLSFEQVEVPTDKAGLIDHLNAMLTERREAEDQYEPVVERNDPPIESEHAAEFDLQRLFAEAPLQLQSELAVQAIDRLNDAANRNASEDAAIAQASKPADDADDLLS